MSEVLERVADTLTALIRTLAVIILVYAALTTPMGAVMVGQVDSFLFGSFLGTPTWMWLLFLGLVGLLLAFDLGVLHRKSREIGIRESLALSATYIVIGLAFGGWVWWSLGAEPAMNYVTGFVVEKSLAMDNVFVIAMILGYFAIPRLYHHTVLFWGILGVIVLRAIMIGLGAALVTQFSWILYVFGLFLLATGVKMLVSSDHAPSLDENPLLRFLKGRVRVTDGLHGAKFLIRQPHPATGKMVLWATPMLLALVMIEIADLIFAVDSVPAIFAITQDPFIVYTSNIFAILGLRALFFALSAMIERFKYLKYALAAVLVFIGGKIFLVNIVGKIPPAFSLTVTLSLLLGGVLYSLWRTGREQESVPARS